MILQKKYIFYLALIVISFLTSCLARPDRFAKRPHDDANSRPSFENKPNTANLLSRYAKELGVGSGELNDLELYSFIDEWKGIPHRLGGQTRDGIDCSAFINELFNKVYKKSLPRSSADMANDVKRKYENQLVEGDLVFFSFGKGPIDHVGLYLRNNKFVHVSTNKGVIISDLHESWYYKYFVRAGTVK